MMEDTLQTHVNLCDQIYTLALEENHILKETNKTPEEGFLNRKRDIIAEIDASIHNLRAINARPSSKTPQQRSLIEKAQQIILKTLLLDRENEQLLLKCTLVTTRPSVPLKPSLNHLQRIYGKH